MIVDFREISEGGEDWEAFTRDFLFELGFTIDTPPDRGADGGKDLLVSEPLKGTLNSYPFRWLVSCKHYAVSGKSISEREEPNVLERMRAFRADGFIGFYSTIASSGLNDRLVALRDSGDIRDFKIFDRRLLENYLIRIGYSKLLMRYLPESYKRVKPLHLIIDEYLPLNCEHCGKDLLEELDHKEYGAIVSFARELPSRADDPYFVHDMFWTCKGECDRAVKEMAQARYRVHTGWEDISDLVIPVWYLRWVLTTMNQLRSGRYKYSDEAYRKAKHFLIAMGQKVLREMTERERERVVRLGNLPEVI